MRRQAASVFCFVLVVLAGCSSAAHTNARDAAPDSVWLANGRSIFQTGKDLAGKQIVARYAPLYSSCAACHGANGAGSRHLPGGAVSADLRHDALITKQRHPYTLTTLERAISTGIDNEGQSLNPVMPRWQLSRADLHDAAYYVLAKLRY